jgi:hypothetical protein
MKRVMLVLVALLLVFGLVQLSAPKTVSAGYIGTVNLGLATNDWTGGDVTTVDFTKYPAPNWLQLMTDPVKVTTPGKICHDFRGGQFYWTPEIRELKDGKWIKIPSTAGWVPTTEGKYVVCAQAPAVGVYALFGFYNPPANLPAQEPDFS